MLLCCIVCFVFFFKQKTAYEMRISDWSSDVCSSDLGQRGGLDFWHFVAVCGVPALLALVIVYGTVRWVWRAELDHTAVPPPDAPPLAEIVRWQIAKGLAATLLLVALFATPEPREVGVLAIPAALAATRQRP